MILGFTGSRCAPTDKQYHALSLFLFDNDVDELHHGACMGADLMAHRAAINFVVPVVVHPPIKETYLAWECLSLRHDPSEPPPNIAVLPRKEYHARNRDIVHACDTLFAMPNGPRRPHSGTWYTIDYAKDKVPVVICWPDGKLEKVS